MCGLFATLWTVATQSPCQRVFEAGILERLSMPSSRGYPHPGTEHHPLYPCFDRFFITNATQEAPTEVWILRRNAIYISFFSFLEFICSSLLNANATFIIPFFLQSWLALYVLSSNLSSNWNSSCLIYSISFCCTEYQPYGRPSITDFFFELIERRKRTKMARSKCLIRWYKVRTHCHVRPIGCFLLLLLQIVTDLVASKTQPHCLTVLENVSVSWNQGVRRAVLLQEAEEKNQSFFFCFSSFWAAHTPGVASSHPSDLCFSDHTFDFRLLFFRCYCITADSRPA